MGEILTTLTANRLLPWPAWWNKHELKKPTTTKIIFLFSSPWGFVLETELSGKYTLVPFEFSLYIFFYNSSCCEDQFTAVFLLRKCSLIQFTPSRSARLSSLNGLMLWFMPTYRFYSNKRPTSNLRPPRISAHPHPTQTPPSVPASRATNPLTNDFGHRGRRQRQRIHLLTWVARRLKLELN